MKTQEQNITAPLLSIQNTLSSFANGRGVNGEYLTLPDVELTAQEFQHAIAQAIAPGRLAEWLGMTGTATETHEAFFLFALTAEEKFRSAAYSLCMLKLAEYLVRDGRTVERRGTMQAVSQFALELILEPKKHSEIGFAQFTGIFFEYVDGGADFSYWTQKLDDLTRYLVVFLKRTMRKIEMKSDKNIYVEVSARSLKRLVAAGDGVLEMISTVAVDSEEKSSLIEALSEARRELMEYSQR